MSRLYINNTYKYFMGCGYDERFYERNPEMKSLHQREKVLSCLENTKKIRFAVAFIVSNLLSTVSAYGQEEKNIDPEINILTGCVQIDDNEKGKILVCDSPIFTKYNDILNESGMDVVNADGFWNFLQVFAPILEILDERVGLTAGDIISAMNLYDAQQNREADYIEFILRYIDFVSGFPNPELKVEDILRENGIFLND